MSPAAIAVLLLAPTALLRECQLALPEDENQAPDKLPSLEENVLTELRVGEKFEAAFRDGIARRARFEESVGRLKAKAGLIRNLQREEAIAIN